MSDNAELKNVKFVVTSVVVLFVFFVLSGGIFIITEGSQAVVTQFGKPVGDPVTEAGIHLKIPFIQKVSLFEKRILRWDGAPNQIPTKEKKYIWVDTTARWEIVNALRFMESLGSENAAQSRLDDIIDAVVRDNVSSHTLLEIVRSTNRKIENSSLSVGVSGKEKRRYGRKKIIKKILKSAREITIEYGINIIDFRIKRINYVESVQKKVFERMISERNRIAAEFRSQGEGRKAEILGNMEKDLQQIRSIAYKRSQQIKGKADALVTKMFGESFSRAPEFYALIKTLGSYKSLTGKNSTLILSTKSDFFKYIKKP